MANVFTRIMQTIEADFHELLDKKEQKNPIALLNQYLRQSEQEVEKVKKLVERQYVLKDEFTKEYRIAADLAEKRKAQAAIASKAGEMELHQFAINEQAQYEERAARIENSLLEINRQLTELENKYEEMKHKLKDMYIKRMELMGRENITRAQMKMNHVLESTNSQKSASSFAEMESYLDRLEHQVNTAYHRNTIDAKIAQLEKELKKEETHSIS